MGRICILVTMAASRIAFILLSSVIVLWELILLWESIERSRNPENKTTEKHAVSYLFVHRRFKVRLFTSQVLLIFRLLLRRKIVFKDDYIIMQIRCYSHEWTVLGRDQGEKPHSNFELCLVGWVLTRLENRAPFDFFQIKSLYQPSIFQICCFLWKFLSIGLPNWGHTKKGKKGNKLLLYLFFFLILTFLFLSCTLSFLPNCSLVK